MELSWSGKLTSRGMGHWHRRPLGISGGPNAIIED